MLKHVQFVSFRNDSAQNAASNFPSLSENKWLLLLSNASEMTSKTRILFESIELLCESAITYKPFSNGIFFFRYLLLICDWT